MQRCVHARFLFALVDEEPDAGHVCFQQVGMGPHPIPHPERGADRVDDLRAVGFETDRNAEYGQLEAIRQRGAVVHGIRRPIEFDSRCVPTWIVHNWIISS